MSAENFIFIYFFADKVDRSDVNPGICKEFSYRQISGLTSIPTEVIHVCALSLLQYSLDQEIAECVAIVSLIDHHQTGEDLTDRTDEFKDFKHFSRVLGFMSILIIIQSTVVS